MQLINDFALPVDVNTAWGLLTDVEKIASCMPGAELTSVNGNEFKGTIKIKVGPISALFEGKATLEKNDAEHKAIIRVDGADTKGQGFAKGTIIATVVQAGYRSLITYETDITLTGRMASFGRSTMADLSDKLFSNFVKCIEMEIINAS